MGGAGDFAGCLRGRPAGCRRAPLPSQPNAFYAQLPRRAGLFYLCLHYYVYVLLRYRSRFSESFVAGELLPVGNPETRFYDGSLAQGERVQVDAPPGLLPSHALYLTTYNRRNFPEQWCGVEQPATSPPGRVPGRYLIRLHRKAPVGSMPDEPLTVRTIGRDK